MNNQFTTDPQKWGGALPILPLPPMMNASLAFGRLDMESPTPSPAPSTVVSLSSRRSPRPGPAAGLGGMIQEQAKKALTEGISQAFAAIDDDLFRRSELNQALFDGLRELRKRQPLITRLFMERVSQDVEDSLVSAPSRLPATPEAEADEKPVALSLVDERDLEETLAVSRMVASVESSQAAEIHALRERTAMLRGGVSSKNVVIPLAPESVAHAFRDALQSNADIQMAERIVVYKHFERAVMGRLGPLYRQVNEALATAGVLPNLKPQAVVRNQDEGSSPGSFMTAGQGSGPGAGLPDGSAQGSGPATVPGQFMVSGGPGGSGSGGVGDHSGAGYGGQVFLTPQEQEAWQGFRQMVAAQRAPGSGGHGPAASLGDLGQAILALREIHSLLGQLTTNGVAPSEVKEHLLEKLGQGTPLAKSLGEHEDAIDMVALVFDHILKDPDLPLPMQALLARLQVPFIKVAVLEPQLFAKTDHPARRLLDLLGETSKAWSPEADRNRSLYNRIQAVVDAVNDQFVEDPQVFEHQREEFQSFVDDLSARASLTQQRAQEVFRSREKMEQAQSVVTRELIKCTAGKPLPEWARAMLLRHWASYMVLLVLREGEQSQAFKKAMYFAQQVVQAQQAQDDAARKALATVTPALLDQLKEGLTSLGLSGEDVTRLSDTLKAYLDMHAGAAPMSMPAMPPLPPAPSSARLTPRKGPQPTQKSLDAVGQLKVDDWVELIDDKGRKTRGKVSWISSFTRRLLLVTLSGTRLAERPQEELALMLDRGQLRLLENKPLFDRAMGSIVGKLRGQ